MEESDHYPAEAVSEQGHECPRCASGEVRRSRGGDYWDATSYG